MQETFRLNFNITYGEYAKSVFRFLLRHKYLRLFLFFFVGITILSTVLGFMTNPELNISESIIASLASAIGILLFMIVLFFIFTFFLYSINPYAFKEIDIEFNHWGISRKSDRINFSKPWREIQKAEERKTAFHIYISKNDFIIIPKRVFTDNTELHSFGYFLSTRTDFKL